jgi:hypothetical protein
VAAVADALHCHIDDFCDFGYRRGHCAGDERVFGIDDFQYAFSWEEIDIDRAGIAAFLCHFCAFCGYFPSIIADA